MKISKSFLVLVSVCFAHFGYSMENKEEDLSTAIAYVLAAEYRINDMSILTNYVNNAKYKESLLRETVDWAEEAYYLSEKVVYDNSAVSPKTKKEAKMYMDRASVIQGKFQVKKKFV